ncbi:putative nuclease HARBI1 isoform X2 [Temnothorax nylanderi]|uniref:putative nuclease HARBI1 isoform X2 n=1 Tax=Temnothorax nylanderi TaxID=102681 RepID=UPI003A83A2BB
MEIDNIRNIELYEIDSDRDSDNDEDENDVRVPKRFNKDSILYGIQPKIEEGFLYNNNRGLPIPPIFQLLICLRFYATSSFQQVLGDTIIVSQPTVSRVVFRVSVLLARLFKQFIKMPVTPDATRENHRLFRDIGRRNGGIGLPGIDGAIDCTHVRLVHTRFQNIDEVYRNRKGYFSLNVQAVVGPRTEFLDIVPEWPGSQHDSRIFQNSRLYMTYTQGQLSGVLVGDAGYPCLPFLLTPLSNPQTDEEITYNILHRRTRIIVERTFGIWKRRFPCLSRGLSNKLICSTTIVVACAVLHNLSLIFNDVLPEEEIIEEDNEMEVPVDEPHWEPGEGFAIRAALIERLFR